jgi:molecular chaperone DnaK (HSP70)
MPHAVCAGFLPRLGNPVAWKNGRHCLDPTQALAAIWDQVGDHLVGVEGVTIAAPAYLTGEQVRLLQASAEQAKLPVLAFINRTLAAGLTSLAENTAHHLSVVVDVDDHALTCAVFRPREAEFCCLGQQVLPTLGLRLWRERLLARIAESCVRSSRRDPRESPEADQQLFDQAEQLLDAVGRNQSTSVRVQGAHWLQSMIVTPGQATAACAGLARQAAQAVQAAVVWGEQQLTNATIYLTAEAARLPGLAAAIYQRSANKTPIVALPAAGPAEAAFDLAQRINCHELAGGLFGSAVPLPAIATPLGPGSQQGKSTRVESEDWADMLPFPDVRVGT